MGLYQGNGEQGADLTTPDFAGKQGNPEHEDRLVWKSVGSFPFIHFFSIFHSGYRLKSQIFGL